MAPPVPIGGWSIEFKDVKRFDGSSGYIVKSCASGYNAVSGITVTNSGAGVLQVKIDSVDTSGVNYGNYAYLISRLNPGARTVLVEGYLIITP